MGKVEKRYETWDEACLNVAKELAELLISKQQDYGKGNILDFGELGLLVRTNDKVSRIKNLTKRNVNPNNESLDDSWRDIAGYAILTIMLRRGYFALPMAPITFGAKEGDNGQTKEGENGEEGKGWRSGTF